MIFINEKGPEVKNFAELLREARKRAGLTQEELAGHVGINSSYISKIERGLYRPPVRDKVLAITEALGITDQTVRAYFLLAAGCGSVEDLEGLGEDSTLEQGEDLPSLFRTSTFSFPHPDELEDAAIIETIRRLIRTPDLSPEQRRECIDLIHSFLAWLEFRTRGTNEQPRDTG